MLKKGILGIFCLALAGGTLRAQTDLAAPALPVLKSVTDKTVFIDWESPEKVYGLFDDFEGHTDFAINSPGTLGWQYLDMDNDGTFGIGKYQYEGRSEPSAFQVFNLGLTTPPYTEGIRLPHSGKKFLASFATETNYRNDWLISPDLKSYAFDDSIRLSFWARSWDDAHGLEQIKIGYSLTDASPTSFVFLYGGSTIEVPASDIENPGMYYFEYVFPANARYVAINCVTEEGFVLCIDDVAIGTNKLMPTKARPNYLLGYNLYRKKDSKVNTTLIDRTEYTDIVPDYGDYEYTVEAVYEQGTASSPALSVSVPDIHRLPFIENFDSYDLTTNFWEQDPQENYWSVDYMGGRLVDPAATFSPALSLKNYSDLCLVSKELDATELSEVMLSYDIAGDFYVPTTTENTLEYMAVEVFDGQTWRTVGMHDNNNGDFDYVRSYIDITKYVAGKKFKIRFNGGGVDAYQVIAWYVSYVKVYEKAQATVSGKVSWGSEAVEGAELVFTSQDGDVYKALSAADGTYTVKNVDAGSYVLRVGKTGYHTYEETMEIVKGTAKKDIAMLRPVVTLANTSATLNLKAETEDRGEIEFRNTGNGSAVARLNVAYANTTGLEPTMKTMTTFRPSDLLQTAICFDGEYFYTGSQSDTYEGQVWQYDREGNFIESFVPNFHVRRYYDMVFDGMYFYTANGDSKIRIMDFAGRRQVGEILTDIEEITHIAYNKEEDVFYVGGMSTLATIGRDGKTISPEKTIDASFAGSVYDPYFKEGPTMWIFDQAYGTATNPSDRAALRRLDLETGEIAQDYTFSCDQLPGYVHGVGASVTLGAGLYGTTEYMDGHFVLIGAIVADPGLIFVVDLYALPHWVGLETKRVELAANGSFTVPYTVDAADMLNGQSHRAEVEILFEPAIDPIVYGIDVTVNSKADYGKPLNVQVQVRDDEAAVLTWSAPQSENAPVRYYIYRNGQLIDSVSDLKYENRNLKAGKYIYEVSALYPGGQESMRSAAEEVEIYVGIPCYIPKNLTAANVLNKSVFLQWQDPSVTGAEAVKLYWGTGVNYDKTGLLDAGSYIAAVRWTPSDLADYRDMPMVSVAFMPTTAGGATYKVQIYEDGKLSYEKAVANYTSGEECIVSIDKEILLNDRVELMVAIEVTTVLDGDMAMGIDAGPAVADKGNLVKMPGMDWAPLNSMGGSDANFNIALNLDPKEGAGSDERTALGFNVYRDGVKLNAALIDGYEYTDEIDVPGLYTYHVTAVYDICESNYSEPASVRIVDIAAHDAPENLRAIVTMNRKAELYWNHPNTNMGAKGAYSPFGYIYDVDLKNTGEQAVVTDGKNIYTSFWNRRGVFNKYDMAGNFIESFEIPDVGNIYDLTFDGTYFYGGSNMTELYCFDFYNRKLVKTMSVTAPVRHCTYIPDLDNGKGGFEIGEWTSSYFVSMTGAYLDAGVVGLDGAYGSAYHDGKLFFFCQGAAGKCRIEEFSLETLQAVGNRVDLSSYIQLDLEDNARAGGLDLYTAANGNVQLLANIQQSSPRTNKLVWVEAQKSEYVDGFNLYRDGKKVNNELLPDRNYTEILSKAGTYRYEVTAVYVDGVESGKSAPFDVRIAEATYCQAPIDIQAVAAGRDVQLSWTTVLEKLYQGDNLESYAHGESAQAGEWKLTDRDAKPTVILPEFEFEGQGKPAGFRLIDQRKVSPAQKGWAFSGDKALVAFAADALDEGKITYSDDWVTGPVSREAGPKWVSFMARGLEAGKTESFKIAYSSTTSDLENFIYVSNTATEVHNLYTRFVYALPENAKYVGINYVSGNGSALLIDDIKTGTGRHIFEGNETVRPGDSLIEAVSGYYVYRNGKLLTPEPIQANAWFDGNLTNGQYEYQVKALYNTSCESDLSEACAVTVAYSAPGNAPRNLQGVAVDHDVNLTWDPPYYDDARSLTYNLTDPATALVLQEETMFYCVSAWEPADLMGLYGYSLESVTGVFYAQPMELELVVFQGGKLVYRQNVLEDCTSMLVEYRLDEPVAIDPALDLKVGFRMTVPAETPSMVIDGGPAIRNKGDLYSEDGVNWVSNFLYSGVDANWYITANFSIALPFTKAVNTFNGYLVYRNGSPVQKDLITGTTFTDKGLENGTYTYAVHAVYSNIDPVASKNIQVQVGSIANEAEVAAGIRLYPNPASTTVSVEGDFIRLEIFDMQGRLKTEYRTTTGNTSLDVSGWASGVYMMKTWTRDGVASLHKLVVK